MKEKQKIRENFRDAVFKRDGYKCKFCTETEDIQAHHIIDRTEIVNQGYVKENGITLCDKHHLMAEAYHITRGVKHYKGFHPDDLFKLIKSSPELARKMSEKLV